MPDERRELSRITAEDLEAVTDRLNAWVPTLPDQEKLVVSWMLTRAAAARDQDAAEYAESGQGGVPMSSLIADAAGLRDVSGFATGQGSRAIVIGDRAPPVIGWAFRY